MARQTDIKRGDLMKWTVAISVFLFVSTAVAQPTIGTITGTVTNPDGGAAAGVLVQAKHVASGMVHEAMTLATGQYTLSVQQGAYDLIVPAVESKFDRYEQKNVTVTAAQFFYADIRLQRRKSAMAGAWQFGRQAGYFRRVDLKSHTSFQLRFSAQLTIPYNGVLLQVRQSSRENSDVRKLLS
jgi:hypothetical protein